jgi:glycosyltransferase involved in cell wall biosynthesis
MVRWKGLGGIIKSFEKTEFEEAELHLVGDGPERNAIENMVERIGATNLVTFHGNVTHQRVLEIIAECRVLALNSTYEGLPHVVLEAMACETPVVASAVCGTPETIVDGVSGFLVEQNDTDQFAKIFDMLLSNSHLRERVTSKASIQIRNRFNHDRMVENYEELLYNVSGHN